MTDHLCNELLEMYHLGMIVDESELAAIEEHYLGCPECAARARDAAKYVDAVRAGIILQNYDLQ